MVTTLHAKNVSENGKHSRFRGVWPLRVWQVVTPKLIATWNDVHTKGMDYGIPSYSPTIQRHCGRSSPNSLSRRLSKLTDILALPLFGYLITYPSRRQPNDRLTTKRLQSRDRTNLRL